MEWLGVWALLPSLTEPQQGHGPYVSSEKGMFSGPFSLVQPAFDVYLKKVYCGWEWEAEADQSLISMQPELQSEPLSQKTKQNPLTTK